MIKPFALTKVNQSLCTCSLLLLFQHFSSFQIDNQTYFSGVEKQTQANLINRMLNKGVSGVFSKHIKNKTKKIPVMFVKGLDCFECYFFEGFCYLSFI